jgi:hypothetical protein
MKRHERVIDVLLSVGEPYEWFPYSVVCDAALGGDEPALWRTIGYLKAHGLIEVRETDQRTLSTCRMRLTDKGVAYSQTANETKIDNRKKLFRDIMIGVVGAVVGVILTKFLS